MAEIIDILTPLYKDCPHFHVVSDGSVNFVSVTPSASSGILSVFTASTVMNKFQKRDNLRLLTLGLYIPESFVMSDTVTTDTVSPCNTVQIYVDNKSHQFVNFLPGVGSSDGGIVPIPFPNFEVALDVYCDMANLGPLAGVSTAILTNDEYHIRAIATCMNISMIGVPLALNGSIVKIIPFIKVLHTLPMLRDIH